MFYLGDFIEDATVRFLWNSNDDVGASITRGTNGTISVYKDGGTTQTTAGVTDNEDFDSLTGVHHCVIDTSADAFYATGSEYAVVLSAATIDGQTVNAVLACFSIEREAAGVTVDTNNDKSDYRIAGTTQTLDALTTHGDESWSSIQSPASGTAQAGAASTITLETDESSVNDYYNGAIVAITGGAGAGQARRVTDYVGSTRVASVSRAWATNPDGTSTYEIVPDDGVTPADIESATGAALATYDPPTNTELNARTVPSASYATATALQTVDDEIAVIDGNVDSILTDTGTTLDAAIAAVLAAVAALNNLSAADVNAEVVDVLSVDARAEPTTVPASNAAALLKLDYLYMLARNKIEQTEDTQTIYNSAGTTARFTRSVSDATGTATLGVATNV